MIANVNDRVSRQIFALPLTVTELFSVVRVSRFTFEESSI